MGRSRRRGGPWVFALRSLYARPSHYRRLTFYTSSFAIAAPSLSTDVSPTCPKPPSPSPGLSRPLRRPPTSHPTPKTSHDRLARPHALITMHLALPFCHMPTSFSPRTVVRDMPRQPQQTRSGQGVQVRRRHTTLRTTHLSSFAFRPLPGGATAPVPHPHRKKEGYAAPKCMCRDGAAKSSCSRSPCLGAG